MPAKLTEEEKQAREKAKEAKKKATAEERARKKASTTVEKIRQYEADYKKSEEQAAEDRKQRELLLNERNKEAIESALSIEEHRNNEIERLHDFYDVTTDKNHQTTIKINNYKLINLLRRNGFYRYDQDNGAFVYVRIKDNMIATIPNEGNGIIDYFEDYVRNLPERIVPVSTTIDGMTTTVEKTIYPGLILEKMYNNLNQYFSQTMPRLRPVPGSKIETISTVHDTKNSKYLFFRNIVVRISRQGVEEIEYKDIHKYIENLKEDNGKFIWESSIINRDFHHSSSNGMFSLFALCICGANSFPQRQVEERVRCLKSILGYLMHDNYDCNLKAVVFTDSVIDQGTPSGGTGKGIIGKALAHIINKNYGIDKRYIAIPGKDFDTTKDTRYSEGDISTQLIHIEDTKEKFDIEGLYNDITDNVVFRRLHHDPTYHKSKIMISTNHPFDITAPSTKRRVIVFELHNYFNAYVTPEDVLGGRMFESSWTEQDWLAYDNFMVECCEEYMSNGIMDLGEINYADNVLASELRPEVKAWIEEYLKYGYINKNVVQASKFENCSDTTSGFFLWAVILVPIFIILMFWLLSYVGSGGCGCMGIVFVVFVILFFYFLYEGVEGVIFDWFLINLPG